MQPARISALEWEAGSESVEDGQMARILGLDEASVAELSHGRSRFMAPDGEGPAEIAARASRRLLQRCNLEADAVDLIIFSTNTPDLVFPGSACLLQAALETEGTPCLDVRSQCTGFIAALEIARSYIACGSYARILLVTGEVPSHQNRMDGTAPELACMTGDSAAVALVEPARASDGQEGRILACRQRVDGARFDEFWCEMPACRLYRGNDFGDRARVNAEALSMGRIFPRLDRERARETALNKIPGILDEAIAESGLTPAGIDALLVAHVDPLVEDELRTALADRAARVVVSDHAYSYSASLPAALVRERAAGQVQAGETVAMVTAGQGASWGAAVVRA